MMIYAESALWPCPGKCWNNLDAQFNPTVQAQLQPMWQSPCPTCDSLPGSCPYGTYPQATTTKNQYSCVSCQSSMLRQLNRVIAPTQPANCTEAVSTSMCAKGYFFDDTYSYAYINNLSYSVNPCVPCLSAAVDCPTGFYRSVCLTSLVSGMCLPCTEPQLPSAAMMYGQGFAYDDCASSFRSSATCAWFQTPKWGGGYCMVQCAAGYATTRAAVAPFELPACQLCATSCPTPGYYPPLCDEGLSPSSPDCQPCDAGLLPDNAHWVSGCEWACNEKGFYYSEAKRCVPCARSACSPGEIFIGCYGSNPGRCAACSCPANNNNNYVRIDVYLPECTCASCSNASLGVTFVVAPCSNTSDTVLGACQECQLGINYLVAPCSLSADAVCAPCTAPIPGKLLVSQCTPMHDAVYAACPAGLACNGSAWPSRCPEGKVAGALGLCVCPPATTAWNNDECRPIDCGAAGMFPDPKTGGCSWCNSTTTIMPLITSRRGFLGFDASCGCVPGFFPVKDNQKISCWPCGDLACDRAVQRQTLCDGFVAQEPSCECSVGPGVALVSPPSLHVEQLCAIECAPGFLMLNSSLALSPGLYDQYGYINNLVVASSASVKKDAAVLLCPGKPAAANSILLGGSKVLLSLCDDGSVGMLRTDTGEGRALDLTRYFAVPGLRAQIRATALKPHSAVPGLAWIAFTFRGHCDVYIDDPEPRDDCSAVELLSVTLSPDCDLGVCLLLGSLLWGNTFPMLGILGTIDAMAWTPSSLALGTGGTLFLGVRSNARTEIRKYTIHFYARDFSYDLRAPDPVSVVSECSVSHLNLKDMAVGGDGKLYVIAAAAGNGSLLFCDGSKPGFFWQNDDDDAAAATGLLSAEHLLILVSGSWWAQVDLVNRVATRRLPGSAVAYRQGALAVYHSDDDTWQIYPNAMICPIDTVVYYNNNNNDNDGAACSPVQCVRACDAPHSYRSVGGSCLCEPGYYYSSSLLSCLPCGVGAYCPGGNAPPTRCGDNLLTVSDFAKTAAECVCRSGFYLFGGTCFQCPTNHWCPNNGTKTPIPCYAGGITIGSGMSSPLNCFCPPRTYGIACRPCEDSLDCSMPSSNPPLLSATAVSAWGPLLATNLLVKQCLPGLDMQLYTVDMQSTHSLTNMEAMGGDGRFAWQWILVSSSGSISAPGLADCMTLYGFSNAVVQPFSASAGSTRLATEMIQPVPCPVFQEWNGLSDGASACTCVAGYEFISTSSLVLLGSRQCFACLNGTVRPKGSAFGCTASCGDNEEAPYMGMSSCVCARGYSRVHGVCTLLDQQQDLAPGWLSVMLLGGLQYPTQKQRQHPIRITRTTRSAPATVSSTPSAMCPK